MLLLAVPGEAQESLTLEPGDMVFVDVYRQPELSTTAQLGPDGAVVMPYLGPITISGLTEKEAAATISQSLRRYVKRPRVTVSRTGAAFPSPVEGFRSQNMKTELIPLHNAMAEELADSLREMTSEGGAVSFDRNTNTLIVTDTPSALQNIMSVVNRLDSMQSQITQVRIEAKIAEVKTGAMKELGLRWFVQDKQIGGGYYPMPTQELMLNSLRGSSAAPITNENIGDSTGSNAGTGRRFVDGTNNFTQRLNIPVQVPKPGQMFFSYVNDYVDVGVLLDALVADNKAELLATPNVLTSNHNTAEIRSVEEYPFTEYAVDFGRSAFSTEFIELGIILRVTPHVQQDEKGKLVKLELEPEVSYPVGTNNGVPIRAVRRSKSEPIVRNGQTLVVGGIYRNDHRNFDTGVPVLGKVPVVGPLFRHTERVQEQTELMVFVTPTVHDKPDTITWDRMINLTSASEVLEQMPVRETLREVRQE